MKTQVTAILTLALLALNSLAQNTSTTKMTEDTSTSARGVRVSLVKPTLDADLKASYMGTSISVKEKLADTLGVSIGYVNLPVQEIGWTTNLALMDIKNGGSTTSMARIDGNLAYAFSQKVNVKGGLNLSKFTSGQDHEKLNPAIGLQAGLGVQVNRNFGIDFGYTQMNQTGSVEGINVELKESGMELGINGTF